MKKLYLTFLASLFTTLAFSQLENPDFENWDTDTTGILTLADWQHFTGHVPSAYGLFSWQDTNAEHGKYALTISRAYMGEINDWVQQKALISYRPSGLKGFYKYIDNRLVHSYDTAFVEVFLTKWNTSLSVNDTIGSGIAALSAISSYNSFNCLVDYIDGRIPDSIVINIMPTHLGYGVSSSGPCDSGTCSFLTIDNLSLSAPEDVAHFETQYTDIYPNPVTDKLIVRTAEKTVSTNPFELIVTDMLGKVVLKTAILQQITEIDMSHMLPGNYFLVIKNNSGMVQTEKLVKE